ncbi:lipase family protein [Parahaliea mediterranea]|nr:lipase family protein [Parahaliea mediterranea]
MSAIECVQGLSLLVIVALGLAGQLPIARAAALGDSDIGEFYRFDGASSKAPGLLLRQEPLEQHQSLARASQNIRLLYTSTEGLFARETVAVSGALYLPRGEPPEAGWPLLVWAHGTVGIADVCAPSWNGRQQRDSTYLNYWLANGYAIAASDYQGLGTRGTHPYLSTRPSAYSNLDIVRAVSKGGFPVSDAVVVIGQSQGAGAALATAMYAPDYAGELDIRGVVATGAPYFSAEGLAVIQATRPTEEVDPTLGYNFLALSKLSLIDPDFVLEDYVSEQVLPVARSVSDTCYAELKERVVKEGVSYNKAFKKSPANVLQPAFKRMEYPTLALSVPVFIGIGGKDLSTPARMQQALVKDACAAGAVIEAHFYRRGTHSSVVNGSTEDSSVFVEAAFSGVDITGNCNNLPF